MVRSLAQVVITDRSIFQAQMNYRTMLVVITANGRPIMACSTRQEADDMIVYLNDRKPKQKSAPLDVPLPSVADLWGE